MLDAFLDGLSERARAAGHDLSGIASVASFFVSRVDTEIDQRLDEIGTPEAAALRGARGHRERPDCLRPIRTDDRLAAMAGAGGIRRPSAAAAVGLDLGVKDPAYPRHALRRRPCRSAGVVNTMPEATLRAVADHGVIPADSIRGRTTQMRSGSWSGLIGPRRRLPRTSSQTLEEQALTAFRASWDRLSEQLAADLQRYRPATTATEGTGPHAPG